jgi:hypothetical protein
LAWSSFTTTANGTEFFFFCVRACACFMTRWW